MYLETQQSAFTDRKHAFLYKEGEQTATSFLKLVCSFYTKLWLFIYLESNNFRAPVSRVAALADWHVALVVVAPLTLEFVSNMSGMSETEQTSHLCLVRSVELWLVFFFSRCSVSCLTLRHNRTGGLLCCLAA